MEIDLIEAIGLHARERNIPFKLSVSAMALFNAKLDREWAQIRTRLEQPVGSSRQQVEIRRKAGDETTRHI